jgi:predicted nucleic acid-binding protein
MLLPPNASVDLPPVRVLYPFHLLNLNDLIMERYADIRSYLRRRGELFPDFDILLAATAIHHNLAIPTHNTRHLQPIPDVQLYQPQ